MSSWMVVAMMVVSGAIMAFQAPINAALRGHVGTFESSLISFCIGTLALIAIVAATREGNLSHVRNVSWWQLLGGLIGAIFVTTTLLAAPKIGVTGMIVDNTFCSPYLQQPFRLGADFVVHSLTKFVNGHSTSVAGSVLGPFRFMKEELFGWYKNLGPSPSPFDAWLDAVCVQDLAVRIDAQCTSAGRIARLLRRHRKVNRVFYPGFDDFPQAELVREQMRRGGSLVSFELSGGRAAGEALMNFFARRDTPMELAVSLGSAISYIQHPASMTHAVVPEADRLARGITPGLVRLSVGLEGPAVLEDFLGRALDEL